MSKAFVVYSLVMARSVRLIDGMSLQERVGYLFGRGIEMQRADICKFGTETMWASMERVQMTC